jgi:ABC-type cobalamin/Fe3+-siderophores transport system ATPase subunit
MSFTLKKLSVDGFLRKKKVDWSFKQVNVLVGKNGSGKTSLLRIINTLLKDHDDSLSCMALSGKIELKVKEEPISIVSDRAISDFDILNKVLSALIKIDSDSKNNFIENLSDKFSDELSLEDNIKNVAKQIAERNKLNTKRTLFIGSSKDNFDLTPQKMREKFNVEFISTVNLSSNSISQYIGSDGNTKSTILDLEIEKEFSRLQAINKSLSKILINKFIASVNCFFKDSNKEIIYKDNKFTIKIFNDEFIDIQDLSSGERQLIYIFLKLVNSSKKTIFLMDEPEISLHLEWQEKLISEIMKLSPDCQLIIVTHSPAIVMNGWMDSYIDIDDILVGQ